MRSVSRIRRTVVWCVLALLPALAGAQGTPADYARAENLRSTLQGLVVGAPEPAHWIDGTSRFWYRKSVAGGDEFVLVDATTQRKQPAFDQARIAAVLDSASPRHITALRLPFSTITFADSGQALEFAFDSALWHCGLASYHCTTRPLPPGRRGQGQRAGRGEADQPRVSPDGTSEAFIRNFNVFVRPVGARQATALSWDGSEGNAYQLRSIVWSPDSRKLAAYRVIPGYHRRIQYVESSPEDQLQPKYTSREYAKPGDVLDKQQPVLFDVAAKREIVVDDSLLPNAYALSRLEWRDDGNALTFEYNQRGHQVYRVVEVNAATGKARAVIDEESPTFFCYSCKKFRFDIADGKEIIWMSERDGWNHLYLYDGVTGRVKNQITKGEWVVRGVDTVDAARRQIWFHASGMDAGQDPYFIHYYRINFDGTGLTPLTEANGTHVVSFSPDMQYYVDTWSRVDLPAISQLRRTSDRKVLAELEHGDDSKLLATGWRPPEPFMAMGRDGKTPIWGVIIRPMHFDSTRKYPVIENIYAGPQDSFVPKAFGLATSMQAQAELGFIVVQIDGMGTSNRSKAFHDVAWKNLGDAGFPDRILWHRAVAARYPYYDISRVGIYGTSAGGQNSLGALLFHPEFYKAAVSAAGCHDNRMDKIWWNEQWMGWPLGPQYAAASNVDNAYRLQGQLLLVVGEMDTNVDPASTMQVVNALIKANKTFDLLVIPGADHTSGGAYGERKRFDFFVHHLLGVEPPDRNITTVAQSSGEQ